MLSTAQEDIESIASYLGKYGIQTVGTFTGKLRSQVQLIAFGTVDYGLSRLPEFAERGYHTCQVNNYVMLYFYEGDESVIAHLVHQSQDYARLV